MSINSSDGRYILCFMLLYFIVGVVGPDGLRVLAFFEMVLRFLAVEMTDLRFLSFLAVCGFLS